MRMKKGAIVRGEGRMAMREAWGRRDWRRGTNAEPSRDGQREVEGYIRPRASANTYLVYV